MMHEPHEIVLKAIQKKWEYNRSKSFVTKLLELGEIKATATIILQTEYFDEIQRRCSGKILHRWKYDYSGLHNLSEDIDVSQQKVDYCCYCIDKEQKRIVVQWDTILPSASTRKHLHYFDYGAIYEIVRDKDVDVFKVIRTWIE